MSRRPAPPSVRTADLPSSWDRYVERFGVLTAVALMIEILALAAGRVHPSALGRALAGPQLLLLLVVVACIAVLSYRSDAS